MEAFVCERCGRTRASHDEGSNRCPRYVSGTDEIASDRITEAMDNAIVYYGPHPCDLCGLGLIAKSGNGWTPIYRFDYPYPPVYPNSKWRVHVCHAHPVDGDGSFEQRPLAARASEKGE